jgi:hypothetical protein
VGRFEQWFSALRFLPADARTRANVLEVKDVCNVEEVSFKALIFMKSGVEASVCTLAPAVIPILLILLPEFATCL